MKKFLSLLLAAMMIFSVLPTAALADGMKTLDMAPVGEVSTPAEEPTQPAEPAQPAEQEQPAAPAEEPAEQPAAEENEAPVLRAPAAAGAAVPAPSATNGFVEEIYFPVSAQKGVGDKLERIQGFTFDKNVTSYDVVLPEIPGVFGQASVNFGIAIPSIYVGGLDELYYQVYFNGVLKTAKPVKLKEAATRVIAMKYMKDIKVGKVSKMTIVVGLVNPSKTAFEYSDVYEFNLTRQASIKTMQLSVGGSSLAVSPTPDFTQEPYVRDYYVITPENNVTLNITASSGAKIYVGENEIESGKAVDVDLTPYRMGEDAAKLPITVKHTGGEVETETSYNLYVCKNDYTPVITEQPKSTVVEKTDATPLTVAATADVGTLTYKWYEKENNITRKIKGATETSYLPPREYSGKMSYFCIVTNTVDGIPYETKSEAAEYEVKLTYLTAPKCYVSSENGSAFYENGRPLLEARVSTTAGKSDKLEDGARKINAKIYRTDKNESEGGVLVAEVSETYKSVAGCDVYEVMLSPQSVLGTYYYYCLLYTTPSPRDS